MPTQLLQSLTSKDDSTCGAEFPANTVPQVDCITTQTQIFESGCCDVGTTLVTTPCARCDDFNPTGTVPGDGSETCADIFSQAEFAGLEDGSPACGLIQTASIAAGCCGGVDADTGATCTRCMFGEDDFLSSKFIGSQNKTCDQLLTLEEMNGISDGSFECDLVQMSTTATGCCGTDDPDGCFFEIGSFAQCVYDNPDCEDTCVDTEADTNVDTGDEVDCEDRDALNRLKTCCPACSSEIQELFDCNCDDPNGGSGGIPGALLSQLVVTAAVLLLVSEQMMS
jgi:hypothetical protein